MNAKELFKKLGYEDETHLYHRLIRFVKHTTHSGLKIDKIIEFELGGSEICLTCYYGKYDMGCFHLKDKELQAINKQIEELGWNK
jgi:hypothetical protein